jgi:hypothetical protein
LSTARSAVGLTVTLASGGGVVGEEVVAVDVAVAVALVVVVEMGVPLVQPARDSSASRPMRATAARRAPHERQEKRRTNGFPVFRRVSISSLQIVCCSA